MSERIQGDVRDRNGGGHEAQVELGNGQVSLDCSTAARDTN